jgi:hypothetical protein
LNDHPVVYQQHLLDGLTGPVNPGHHATLRFPDVDGAGRLSFSRLMCARTLFRPLELAKNRGYSTLKPDVEIADLHAVPCLDGSLTDLCRYPARRGFEDLAILCADPSLEFAWSAVTFPDEGYVWFALRDPRQLASTVLWFSNGGRYFPPWNGRHVNVLGVEDVTAFFHVGLEASSQPNLLSERGVRTCLAPDSQGQVSIRYIQGVTRIPTGFDEVQSIEAAGQGSLVLRSSAGPVAFVGCELDFLRTGRLPGLELP